MEKKNSMSESVSVPSLSTLPVELLYRLLDYLDIETILLSFRYVSKRFYIIASNSNHYNLDFRSISKNHFDSICRRICPEKIISITLSDDELTPGQIGLFFSLFQITDFPRLRSLTLRQIDSNILHAILQDLLQCSLTSFSFYSKGKRSKSTFSLLSTLITQSNLQTLSMNTHAHHIEKIFLSIETQLVHLTIGILTFEEYQTILHCCSYLQVFILDDCWIKDTDRIPSNKSYSQLTSLTLRDTNRSMTQLESLLSLTPSLIQLKLINSPLTANSLLDGFRWELFIKNKFSSLKIFQFVFHQLLLRTYESDIELESLIKPFRTSFWLEDKRCFINCESIKICHTIKLYSCPFVNNLYEFNFDSNSIFLSTSIEKINFDHVKCLTLNLTEIKTKQNVKLQECLFLKVTELKLRLDCEWPMDSLQCISTLIDLSNLQNLSFRCHFEPTTVSNTFKQLTILFHRASNITSLTILPLNTNGQYNTTMTALCSIVPVGVKHFTVKIQTLDEMKIVTKILKNLSSVSFHFPSDRKIHSHEMIDWLLNNSRDLTYLENEYSLHFWFR